MLLYIERNNKNESPSFLDVAAIGSFPPLSNPCSQIHSLLLEDKVDYGIGYSYRSEPTWQAGTTIVFHSQLYPPQSGIMNWASACMLATYDRQNLYLPHTEKKKLDKWKSGSNWSGCVSLGEILKTAQQFWPSLLTYGCSEVKLNCYVWWAVNVKVLKLSTFCVNAATTVGIHNLNRHKNRRNLWQGSGTYGTQKIGSFVKEEKQF
jgi:hypothetical protein